MSSIFIKICLRITCENTSYNLGGEMAHIGRRYEERFCYYLFYVAMLSHILERVSYEG